MGAIKVGEKTGIINQLSVCPRLISFSFSLHYYGDMGKYYIWMFIEFQMMK